MRRQSAPRFLALLALLALAGCAAGGGTSTAQGTASTPTAQGTLPTATSKPTTKPFELTFIGSDGNVWEMTWPQGQPKQLTNDAKANSVRYSGLAWSPDGAHLAVLRETGQQYMPTSDELRILAPDGTVVTHASLKAPPYNTPFSWSPDGKTIAYREATDTANPTTQTFQGTITLVDAQTGATEKTVTYDDGPGGCGGAFPPLEGAVMGAHQAYQGLDAFAWFADGQRMLVGYDCANDQAARVDLSSGTTTPGFPEGATFQPGGNLILGNWFDQNGTHMGLADQTGAHQKTLVTETPPGKNGPFYDNSLGMAVWSPDGQTIYYEQNNSIFAVGADGSNAHMIVAGTADDSNMEATVEMLPSPSPDGNLLLYLQLHGSDILGSSNNPQTTAHCYVAQPDGTGAVQVPQGATWAVWRPSK